MAWTPWNDIWSAYNEHTENQGLAHRYRITPAKVQERLKSKECAPSRQHGMRGWQGVELKAPMTMTPMTPMTPVSRSFSTKEILEEVTESTVMPVMPVMNDVRSTEYVSEYTFEELTRKAS
jgi:hypothetical protein